MFVLAIVLFQYPTTGRRVCRPGLRTLCWASRRPRLRSLAILVHRSSASAAGQSAGSGKWDLAAAARTFCAADRTFVSRCDALNYVDAIPAGRSIPGRVTCHLRTERPGANLVWLFRAIAAADRGRTGETRCPCTSQPVAPAREALLGHESLAPSLRASGSSSLGRR